MSKDFRITEVKGREIIDCRGYPTVPPPGQSSDRKRV